MKRKEPLIVYITFDSFILYLISKQYVLVLVGNDHARFVFAFPIAQIQIGNDLYRQRLALQSMVQI